MAFPINFPSAPSLFSAYATVSASIVLLQTMINSFLPRWLRDYLWGFIYRYFHPKASPRSATIVIEDGDRISANVVYEAAEIYLCARSQSNIERLKVLKRPSDPGLTVKFAKSEVISDRFDGMELEWRFVREERKNSESRDKEIDRLFPESSAWKQFFELSFDKINKEKVINSYLPYVLQRVEAMKEANKIIRLHTLSTTCILGSRIVWDSITLDHPSTFETLAMDPQLKKFIIDDLDRFLKRKQLYRRVGKAWKRGYLLYGPPGTGKSSLIAAIANYLKFDVYDLELSSVKRDSDLRSVLLRTANRSILVIEDIDCSVQLPDRGSGGLQPRGHGQEFSLSGLLNFIDGLWSSCVDERIIIFTTNDKSKLDAAIVRPGRMDVHLHLSYLTIDGFHTLVKNYLDVELDPSASSRIERLLTQVNVTPAEAAEELMRIGENDDGIDRFVRFVNGKREAGGSDNSRMYGEVAAASEVSDP